MELTIDQALQKAVEAHKAGQVQEAHRLYSAILKAQPEHPDANHNMGLLAIRVNKTQEAVPFFKTALQANPSIAQFWLSYIDALIKQGLIDEARAVFKKAQENGAAGNAFKKLEYSLKSSLGAVTTTSASDLQLKPPKELLNELTSLYNNNQFTDVLEKARAVIEQFPDAFSAWILLAGAAAQVGRQDEAILAFQKVISLKPDYADAYFNIGVILKSQGKLDEAIEAYGKAIAIQSDHAKAYNNMGIVFKELGKLDDAIEAYSKAISFQPNYAIACNNKGNVLKAQGNHDQALAAYNKALKISPDYAEALINKATLLYEQGRLDEAIKIFNKSLSIKPHLAEAYNKIGIVLKDQGKIEEAAQAYRQALEINPDFDEARTNLAILLFDRKKYREASKLFSMDKSIRSQTFLLKCFYELDEKTKFYEQLNYLIKSGENNSVIGSLISRAEIRYGLKKHNPFCNNPFKYVLKKDLTKACNFKKLFKDNVTNVLSNDQVKYKAQGHLKNGIQTAGNIFHQVGSVTNLWQNIIRSELNNYKNHFSDSDEGFIKDWPSDFRIHGWLVSMKNGGELAPHIHDTGWITGSIYINVPPKSKNDSGNLVVANYDPKYEKGNSKDIKSIDVITGSLCLFPSSLLHYTIPFESKEDRIVLAFDVIPL